MQTSRATRRIDWEVFRNKRIKKLVSFMKREGLDALLLNRIENVRYSTDFRPVVSMWFQTSYSSIVTSSGDTILLTVAGDFMHAQHYMPWMKDIRIMHTAGRAVEVASVFRDYRSWRVGYDQLGFEDREALEKAAKGVELVGVGGKISEVRAVKLEEELEVIKEGSRITEASIRAALACAKPGLREFEIAAAARNQEEFARPRVRVRTRSSRRSMSPSIRTPCARMNRSSCDRNVRWRLMVPAPTPRSASGLPAPIARNCAIVRRSSFGLLP